MKISAGTLNEMRSEVATFIARGIPVDEACRIVGLPRDQYRDDSPVDRLGYLPTPAEIAEATARIRRKWMRRSA